MRCIKNRRLLAAFGLSLLVHLMVLAGFRGYGVSQTFLSGRVLSVNLSPSVASRPSEVSKSAEPGEVNLRGESTALPRRDEGEYFSAGQLSQQPVLIKSDPSYPLPVYPEAAVFRLWIDDLGQVIKMEPVTEGLTPAFIAATRAYFKHAEFVPGFRPGGSVNSVVEIALNDR